MKNLIRRKAFITAFLPAYLLFSVLTLIFASPEISSGGAISAGQTNYGFPFIYYSSYCFGGSYFYLGLFGNILFAGVVGFFVGLFYSHLKNQNSIPAGGNANE